MSPAGRRKSEPHRFEPPADGTILQHPAPPRGALVSGHFFQALGYRVIRQKGAGSWLLTFTVGGQGLYRQNAIEQPALPGDAILLAPESYNDYGVATAGGTDDAVWDFHWIHFQPRDNWTPWKLWPEIGAGLWRVPVVTEAARARIVQAFERIHRDLLDTGPAVTPLVYSALEEILTLIAREQAALAAPLDPRIALAMEQIRANLAADHAVDNLARLVSLSPSRFAHLFKEQTGESVTQWILKMKIQQAQRLLSFTDERISDIAYTLGFQSPFYFSKQFRLWTHQSPRQYRQSRRDRKPGDPHDD